MSLYSPGVTPWKNSDGTGSWLGDHSVNADCLFLPAGSGSPKGAAAQMLFSATTAEAGTAIAWTGLDGRKLGSHAWGWDGAHPRNVKYMAAPQNQFLSIQWLSHYSHQSSSTGSGGRLAKPIPRWTQSRRARWQSRSSRTQSSESLGGLCRREPRRTSQGIPACVNSWLRSVTSELSEEKNNIFIRCILLEDAFGRIDAQSRATLEMAPGDHRDKKAGRPVARPPRPPQPNPLDSLERPAGIRVQRNLISSSD